MKPDAHPQDEGGAHRPCADHGSPGAGPSDAEPCTPPTAPLSPPREKADRRPFSKLKFSELKCAYTDRSQKVWDSETPGLGIRLSPGGARNFIVQGRIKGVETPVTLTLGRASDESLLKEVRLEALQKQKAMDDGIDPRVAGQKAAEENVAKKITLQQIFDMFKMTNQKKRGAHSGPRRETTLRPMQYTLDAYLEGIKDKPVASITPKMCATIFDAITAGGLAALRKLPGWHTPDLKQRRHRLGADGAPTTANGVMTTLHTLLEFARNEYRDASTGHYPILAVNPVTQMQTSRPPHEANARDGRIHDKGAIRAVYRMLKLRGRFARLEVSRTGADWLRWRMLSGMRPAESARLRFRDVDFDNNRITVPDAKNHRLLVLPLSAPMRELLLHRRALHQARRATATASDDGDAWIFPSKRSKKSGHVEVAYKACAKAGELAREKNLIPYDLRRTFVDVAIACRIDGDIRRRLMGHRRDVHDTHYANNPEDLVAAIEAIGQWYESPEDLGEVATSMIGPPKPAKDSAWRDLETEELARLVWEMPATRVCLRFGVTDTAVRWRCKALGIHGPARGYWQKAEVRKILKEAPSTFEQPPRS